MGVRLAHLSLHAPTLIEYEMASAALRRSRRDPAETPRFFSGLLAALDLGIELHPVDYVGAMTLAVTTNLSVYDAAYLWLARHLALPLITLDRKLAGAAARH